MQSRQLSAPEDPEQPALTRWPEAIDGDGEAPAAPLAHRLRSVLSRRSTLVNAALAVLIVAGGVWGYRIVWGTGGTSTTSSGSTGRQVTVGYQTVTATVSTS
ncbi:MAG TPA: hypothetical protein VKB69_11405, partial [Micromonosporaceae bacterium]|nr:hypothetical protein [Micromonosporaceae bacterium]